MFGEYIQAALEKAQYKVIDNGDEPYFEDWIKAHLLCNLDFSQIGGQATSMPLQQSKRETSDSW